MNSRNRRRFVRRFAISCLTAATPFVSTVARAQVVEPNGVEVPAPPTPMSTETTLQAYFSGVNETLDAVADAAAEPGTFSPLCDFDATLVLSESQALAGIAWYNVPASDTAAIPPAEVHMIVPPGTPLDTVVNAEDIRSDPAYAGGFIGFALMKDFNDGQGPQIVYYSEYQRNALCSGCTMPDHWKMALVYRSTVDTSTYYLAFEDWEGANATTWQGNDGDFNDKVFRLHGISCAGGGLPCTIEGKVGRCAAGLTECQTVGGGPAICKQIVAEKPETCDDVDNDCNGEIDDGELCDEDQICLRGTCVGRCDTGEFQCPPGLTCDNGYCVDPDCAGLDCPLGQVCRGGECIDSCSGIVCPVGQDCIDGRCIAACAGVECPAGSVCDRGVCVGLCSCTGCPAGTECGPDGVCVEPDCEAVSCPPGETCVGGACVDVCAPAVCPGGAECSNGTCGEPTGTGGTSGSGGGARGGVGGAVIQGGSSNGGGSAGVIVAGTGGSGAGGGDEGELGKPPRGDPGCACGTAPLRGGVAFLHAGMGLGLLLFARRRAGRSRAL
jgi:hypothetical protein